MENTSNRSTVNRPRETHSASGWKCFAITLDPASNRYHAFLKNNSHLQIKAFQAIKGSDLSKEEIASNGLATEELLASGLTNEGRIGCAASHRALWHKSAKDKKGYFVLEDDCYTHPEIISFINNNIKQLMSIDICFFGVNTNSILQSVSPSGMTSLSIFEPRNPNEAWIKTAFSATSTDEVKLHRLVRSFGNCAYFISPKGSKNLELKIFPLSTRKTYIPLISDGMVASGLDRAANAAYPQLQAYVCQPFLAYTPNIDSSTER